MDFSGKPRVLDRGWRGSVWKTVSRSAEGGRAEGRLGVSNVQSWGGFLGVDLVWGVGGRLCEDMAGGGEFGSLTFLAGRIFRGGFRIGEASIVLILSKPNELPSICEGAASSNPPR